VENCVLILIFSGFLQGEDCYSKKISTFALIKTYNIMVIEIDGTVTAQKLQMSLERIKEARAQHKKPNLSEFFGALPNIGDGLKFQNEVRNEWS
jgi:hypothetical protein